MLHPGTSFAGGEGGFAESPTAAAWEMVPSVARALALAGYLAYALPQIDLPSAPDAAVATIWSALSGFGLVSGAVVAVTVAWAAYTRTYGMVRARNLDVELTVVATVGLSLVGPLFELLRIASGGCVAPTSLRCVGGVVGSPRWGVVFGRKVGLLIRVVLPSSTILSDSDILSRLAEGNPVVDSMDDMDMQVQPASVDLHLGTEFLELQRTSISRIHPNRESEVPEYVRETHVPEGDDFIPYPDNFALGMTKGRVEIPTDLLATVGGRSSLGCLAVVIHTTAGIVDPGYRDQITPGLSNLGTAPVVLTPGICILQFAFTGMKSPADRSYGIGRGSKYQGQRGP